MRKFPVNYVVLLHGHKGYESTYFATHARAFDFSENHPATVKGVYSVKARNPMILTPLNMSGMKMFAGAVCPVFQMQRHFMSDAHNIQFTV
jgi:hypothetical protein